MTDAAHLARLQEIERVLTEAVADVPLTATGPETAAALQSLALKLAERCMAPATIARALLAQAEGYLRLAGSEGTPEITQTGAAHAILSQAIKSMTGVGMTKPEAGEAMLTFVAAWLASADRRHAASTLYQLADAIAAPSPTAH